MDAGNPPETAYIAHYHRSGRSDARQRGTIHISSRAVAEATPDELKRWYGVPPAPLPEHERAWRPQPLAF